MADRDAVDPTAAMAAALAEARSRVTRDADRNPTTTPRFLTFGETGAVQSLLMAVFREAPFPSAMAPGDHTLWWRWWLGERSTAVEMAPALLAGPEAADRWDRMEAALGLLAGDRRGRPLDGYLLVLAADVLAAHPDRAGDAAARLLAIVSEAEATLGWRAPIHLVVTGLQAVPGHDAFFAALPARVGSQPLGCRFDPETSDQIAPNGQPSRQPWQSVAGWFSTLTRRLRQLRMGSLLGGPPEANRDDVFRFVEGLPALAPGLAATAAPFESGDGPRRIGSVYLTAPNAAASHLEDVVDRFLVADAGLARPARSG